MEDGDAANGRGGAGLDKVAETAGDGGLEANSFAGPGGAENFHRAEGGEFQFGKRRDLGIALRDGTGELRGGFDEEDAGHERPTGKMAFEKRLVAA